MPSASLRERDRETAPLPRALPKPTPTVEQQRFPNSDGIRIVVKTADGVTLLPLEMIECFEADGNVVIVHAADGERYRIRESLFTMFNQLQDYGFMRVHRGTVVNACAIVGIEKGRYRKAFCVLRTAGKFEIGRVEFQRLRPLWQAGVLDLQALSAGLHLVPATS